MTLWAELALEGGISCGSVAKKWSALLQGMSLSYVKFSTRVAICQFDCVVERALCQLLSPVASHVFTYIGIMHAHMHCVNMPRAPYVGISVLVPCAMFGPHLGSTGPGTILLPRLPPAVLGAAGPTRASRIAQVRLLVACRLHNVHGWLREALNPHVLGHVFLM